jgi:hypothetical protein
MGTDALAQVPNTDHTGVIAADEFTLVWMNNNIIDCRSVNVIALQATSPCIPNLHGAVLRASDHPFSFTVKCDAGDVIRVTFKSNHGIGISRFDIEQFDIVVTGSR